MSEAEIVKRLERLERDNRRLKHVALAAVVLLASTVALGAAYAKPAIPQKSVAHEFDVVDGSGRVQVRLSSDHDIPFITLFGHGQNSMVLSVGGVSGMDRSVAFGPWITFRESDGPPEMSLGIRGGEPNVLFHGSRGTTVWLRIDRGTPSILLRDARGYGMDLGGGQTFLTATGETSQTSAASIVLFGNDKKHHVIWQAPQ